MSKFYILLWFRWVLRVTFCSIILAFFASILVAFGIYFLQDMPSFDEKVVAAIFTIVRFWFPLFWSLTLLIALFRSLKYLFNRCYNGYMLQLFVCDNRVESIESIGYGDLVQVWRKYFMLLIWIVGIEVIISAVIIYFLNPSSLFFEWFDIYILSLFILLAGYFTFVVLGSRCKRVKVLRC